MNIQKTLAQLDEWSPKGYAIALHISFSAPRFLFQTYGQDWKETYTKRGLVLKDPTVLWGFDNTGSSRWSDLEALDTDGVLTLAREFGLNYGFTVAASDRNSRSIASFARGDREFSDDEIASISPTVRQLHDYTAGLDEIPESARVELKKMSIAFTRG